MRILILLVVFFSISPVFASNWIPVESSDGKVAEIDFDSISKKQNTLMYEVKLSTAYNYYTITKFLIDTLNKTYAQVSTTSYENGRKKAFTEAKTLQYKQIKSGSLQDELYKTVSLLVGCSSNSIDKSTLEKYVKEQQKKIDKYWHPNNYDLSLATTQNLSVTLESYVTLILDKQGNIISYGYKDTPGLFSTTLEDDIKNIIFTKIGKFDNLPNSFTGDKLILFIKFYYSEINTIKNNISINNNCSVSYITIAKNHSTFYKTIKDLGGFIITLPFAIISTFLSG